MQHVFGATSTHWQWCLFNVHSLPLTRQALQFLLCLSLILPLSSFLACLSFHLTGSFCCRVAKDCCLPFVRDIMRLVAPPLTIKLHRTRPPKFSTEHARPKKSLAGIVEQNRNREKSFSNSNGNSLELEDCLMFMFVGEIREIDAKKRVISTSWTTSRPISGVLWITAMQFPWNLCWHGVQPASNQQKNAECRSM